MRLPRLAPRVKEMAARAEARQAVSLQLIVELTFRVAARELPPLDASASTPII